MIKGKTIIELTDVNTGEVERHEDDNMVTNALNKIFEPLGYIKGYDYIFKEYSPYHEDLLGGILLFDDMIEENVNNIYAPANVDLVGCGVYNLQNGSSGTIRGNFNVTESEVDYKNKYVKYVYDFATSQGNGTIACACLTSKPGGFTSYGAKDTETFKDKNSTPLIQILSTGRPSYVLGSNTGGSTSDKSANITKNIEYIFAIDPAKDLVFYFKLNSEKSISIVSRKAYLKSISLFETPESQKPIVDSITLADLEKGLINMAYSSYNYNDEEKTLYIISASSNSVTSGKINIIKIEYDSWNITEYEISNETGDSLDSNRHKMFAYCNFLYAVNLKKPYKVYKINMLDSSDITIIDSNEVILSSTFEFSFVTSGRIYCNDPSGTAGYGKVRVINTERDSVGLTESYGLMGNSTNKYTYTPFIDEKYLFYISYGSGSVYVLGSYLATINNLSNPVVKTADKTMKVTYIIQEVAE